jgi:hypothetical protein
MKLWRSDNTDAALERKRIPPASARPASAGEIAPARTSPCDRFEFKH